jgi:hypothetical protein
VCTLVPPQAAEPGYENATISPLPGDGLSPRVDPASIDVPPPRRTGRCQVDPALVYGRHGRLRGPTGDMPGHLFARVTENRAGLAGACGSIRYEGAVGERMRVRRVDG